MASADSMEKKAEYFSEETHKVMRTGMQFRNAEKLKPAECRCVAGGRKKKEASTVESLTVERTQSSTQKVGQIKFSDRLLEGWIFVRKSSSYSSTLTASAVSMKGLDFPWHCAAFLTSASSSCLLFVALVLQRQQTGK